MAFNSRILGVCVGLLMAVNGCAEPTSSTPGSVESSVPEIPGVDVYSSMEPAQGVQRETLNRGKVMRRRPGEEPRIPERIPPPETHGNPTTPGQTMGRTSRWTEAEPMVRLRSAHRVTRT